MKKINENTKVTLTLNQLRKLVKESSKRDTSKLVVKEGYVPAYEDYGCINEWAAMIGDAIGESIATKAINALKANPENANIAWRMMEEERAKLVKAGMWNQTLQSKWSKIDDRWVDSPDWED